MARSCCSPQWNPCKPASCSMWAPVLLAVATLCLLMSQPADAHGHLSVPRSRNLNFFNNWFATAGNGLGPKSCGGNFCRPAGQPGVCGDPYQEVSPNSNIAGITNGPVTTYTSGQTVTFSVLMQVNHGGRFSFRICDRRTNLDQACFSRTLLRADNGKAHWWILSGRFADPPTTVSMTYRLPSGFSCPNGCTIQWTYETANTCIPEACSAADCGFYSSRRNDITGQAGPLAICGTGGPPPEIFRNCADVVISGSGPVPPPGPTPPPPGPTPPPPGPTPPPPGCTDTDPSCAAWGPSQCGTAGVPTRCPCMCPSGGGGCVDTNAACPSWASVCSTNPSVASQCPKTCNRCPRTSRRQRAGTAPVVAPATVTEAAAVATPADAAIATYNATVETTVPAQTAATGAAAYAAAVQAVPAQTAAVGAPVYVTAVEAVPAQVAEQAVAATAQPAADSVPAVAAAPYPAVAP